jgi:hypothetical protein
MNCKHTSAKHVQNSFKYFRQRLDKELDSYEAVLNRLEQKTYVKGQMSLDFLEDKPQHVREVESWLIEERGLKTLPDFEKWLKNKGPDVIRKVCYEATYHKLTIIEIREIAKGCLTPPKVEVVK